MPEFTELTAPSGWRIFEYQGRNQPYTLLRVRDTKHSHGGIRKGWRGVETISFHATYDEAREKMNNEIARYEV